MKFIIKLFPEIIIKSKPVRIKFTNQLRANLGKLVAEISDDIQIQNCWDRLELDAPNATAEQGQQLESLLQNTPGIAHIFTVKTHTFETLEQIGDICAEHYREQVQGKTFVARVKRTGRHSFNSIEAERAVGAAIFRNCEPAGVKMKGADVTVKLEIYGDQVHLVDKRLDGLGGFPLGKQDQVLSLISGGFDSTVASYLTIKRGTLTHFCFFNLGGIAHEVGVKQVAHFIWKKYSASHDVHFISVPFEEVVGEILKNVHHSYMGVVLKRMMMRAAAHMAQHYKIPALVTGEAIAQVSSQTMQNLSVIDRATDHLIIRPLITTDKQDIINMAEQIGTADFAKSMPEYCGVISDKPTTAAKWDKVLEEEQNFDFAVLDKAIADADITRISQVMQNQKLIGDVEQVNMPQVDDVVIDIRAPEEQEKAPLTLTNNPVVAIPFYELAKKFVTMEQDKNYLLYCDRGVMSKMQAVQLIDKGYQNIKVYQP